MLDINFDTGALTNGWVFADNSDSNATLTFADGFAIITNPAGTTYDTYSGSQSTDDTAGLEHAISGDFDVAVLYATPWSGDASTEVGFILTEAVNTDIIRWTPYANDKRWSTYGYKIDGGSGSSFDATNNINYWYKANPAWFRVKRVGNVFTFYGSSDGFIWAQLATVTTPVAPTVLKVLVGQYDQELGQPIRIDGIVDLLAKGGTDARYSVPAYAPDTIEVTDFSGGVPAWLSLDDNLDGNAVLVGSEVQLTAGTADGTFGRILYSGLGHNDNAGILVSTNWPDASTFSYLAFGLGWDDGGGDLDQYSPLPWIGWELGGDFDDLPVRAHRTIGPRDEWFEEYSFLRSYYAHGSDPGKVWYRVEIFGRRVRMRFWLDGDSEPSTWFFDGDDPTLQKVGPLVPIIGFSKNYGTTPGGGSDTIAVESVEFYSLINTWDGSFVRIPNGNKARVRAPNGDAASIRLPDGSQL